jgi:hypothetical protein
MSTRKTSSKKSAPAKGGFGRKLRRLILVLALVVMVAVAALCFVERKSLPADYRNHDAVIMVYKTRDDVIDAVWGKFKKEKPLDGSLLKSGKEPINIRPAAKKPEQGYSINAREELENLIREEGETP